MTFNEVWSEILSEMPLKQRIRIRVKFCIAILFVYLAKYRIFSPIVCLYLKHNGFEV